MSQQTLEKHLWGAATYLRGHIDAGDYKQFIFPICVEKVIEYGLPMVNQTLVDLKLAWSDCEQTEENLRIKFREDGVKL